MPRFLRWFVRRDDVIKVRVPPAAISLLQNALDDLRERLTSGGDGLDRLFPAAYTHHPGLDAEYQRYMREELVASRMHALDAVAESLHARTISVAEAEGWLQATNAARVSIGTLLGVDHDGWTPEDLLPLAPDDPRYELLVLSEFLATLLHDLLDVLMPNGLQYPSKKALRAAGIDVGLLGDGDLLDDDDDEDEEAYDPDEFEDQQDGEHFDDNLTGSDGVNDDREADGGQNEQDAAVHFDLAFEAQFAERDPEDGGPDGSHQADDESAGGDDDDKPLPP